MNISAETSIFPKVVDHCGKMQGRISLSIKKCDSMLQFQSVSKELWTHLIIMQLSQN